jgi:acyl-CoA synthetase (AMP-forming)/AMP-acid ligase II
MMRATAEELIEWRRGAACAQSATAPRRPRRSSQDIDRQGAEIRASRARKTDRGGESLMMRATAEELIEWRRARLARHRRPRHVVFAEIPKTSTGKAPKFALRERAKLIKAEQA